MKRLACLGALATLFAASIAHADDTGGTTKVNTGASDTNNANANASTNVTPNANASTEEKITDVLENKGQSYYFLGVNYRFTIVPQFMVNLFVDEGATFTTNTIGLSFEVRKDHFSIIPGINYTDMGFDPVLFLQKGKDATDPGNWGVVHSTLKAIYVTVDLLWSVPIAKGGQVDFEFGFSAGLGGVFGDLYNTWVSTSSAAGGPQFASKSAGTFYQCNQTPDASTGISPGNGTLPDGCNTGNHQNATMSKTGAGAGYREPNWFNSPGGSVPTVFPWLSLPILGFRFKPIKELEMRLNGGFSITGFFFNFAAYYGFENPKSSPK